MTRPTRAQLAPVIHALLVGGLVTVVLAWASYGALIWMVGHPEAIGVGVLVASWSLGRVVARLPHFGTSERTIESQQAQVHGQIDGVIDRLAIVQAELDLMADKLIHTRANLPDKGVET